MDTEKVCTELSFDLSFWKLPKAASKRQQPSLGNAHFPGVLTSDRENTKPQSLDDHKSDKDIPYHPSTWHDPESPRTCCKPERKKKQEKGRDKPATINLWITWHLCRKCSRINKLVEQASYKINLQKSIIFLYANRTQPENKMHFETAAKVIKWLGIKLPRNGPDFDRKKCGTPWKDSTKQLKGGGAVVSRETASCQNEDKLHSHSN